MMQNLGRLAAVVAAASPDAVATIFEGVELQYADLARRVDALAAALISEGVGKGDRLAALQTPSPDYLVSFLAAATVGAIWVGLNPKHQIEELRHVLEDARPRILLSRSRIGDRDYSSDLRGLADVLAGLDQLVIFDGDPPVAGAVTMADFLAAGRAISPDDIERRAGEAGGRDPCLIVYTSGSTGRPKGALLHHAGVLAFAAEQDRVWPIRPLRVVNYFPVSHIGCVIDVTVPALVAGGTLVFMEAFDAAGCLDLMERHAVTFWCSVPSVFKLQLETEGFARRDLTAVQLIAWEGAAMPRETLAALSEICPRLATNYGMTETGSAITVVEPTGDLEVLGDSVGWAFPQVEIRLAGPDGADVAEGEAGEVWARSPYNMAGYWNQPQATARAVSAEGYFKTGDLAVRRPDGRYRIVGRLKEMYKSGGYNVYPREVEMVLEDHPAVGLAAVVGVPDPVWQEVGAAFVSAVAAVTAQELRDWCRARLANYKTPKTIEVMTALPLLPIGKVDKPGLRRRAMAASGAEGAG
jgi:acyl-CoA synthetase (AMP-forming)/AMP-acid ligase II